MSSFMVPAAELELLLFSWVCLPRPQRETHATQARAFGLIVIGTAGTEKGRELVLKEGAHHGRDTSNKDVLIFGLVFDHKSPDYMDKVKELVRYHQGVDIILEMLANVNLAKVHILLTRGL